MTTHEEAAANGDDDVLWQGQPRAGSALLPFLLCAGLAGAGVFLLVAADTIPALQGASALGRTSAGLSLLGAATVLAIILYRHSLPSRSVYEVRPLDLRIYLRGKLARRLVRGELRMLGKRRPGKVWWVTTQTFSGNASGTTQWGEMALLAQKNPDWLLAQLLRWTCGDEAEAERAAAQFVEHPGQHSRTVTEPMSGLQLSVPRDWPVECRELTRKPLRLLGWQTPLTMVHRTALLAFADDETHWNALRVRASDRAGFYLELSDRCSEAQRQEVELRWQAMGPLEGRTETLPISGFTGIVAEQAVGSPAALAHRLEGRQWQADGVEDGGFGYLSQGGRRLLLWATNGSIALELRAYLPAAGSATEQALQQVLRSIRLG